LSPPDDDDAYFWNLHRGPGPEGLEPRTWEKKKLLFRFFFLFLRTSWPDYWPLTTDQTDGPARPLKSQGWIRARSWRGARLNQYPEYGVLRTR